MMRNQVSHSYKMEVMITIVTVPWLIKIFTLMDLSSYSTAVVRSIASCNITKTLHLSLTVY
jgi:hypothetical protein